MSMFASRTRQTIAIPFEPGQTVTIQKLSGRQVEAAQRSKWIESQQFITAMGGAEYRRQLAAAIEDRRATTGETDPVATTAASPLTQFDLRIVLQRGLVAWTLPDPLTPVPVVQEDGRTRLEVPALEDLDADARDWFAEQILRLTKPALFEAADQAETAQGNASRPSTAS